MSIPPDSPTMNPDRWARMKDLLHRAMELPAEQRPAFLDVSCGPDHSLRRELESLLSANDQARTSFLQSPPKIRLTQGTRLGEYEIDAMIGAGGMGEVYRARDLRLRREVAIKVLPLFATSDPDRLRRFEQEAMAAAALNHPNILAVYQLGTYEGAPYLVSELLEGQTLREQLKLGRIAPRKAIEYGMQVAHGLAAAHAKGIVHRDLKPENLFVTRDGRVKILDFGLAKLVLPSPSSEHRAISVDAETEPGIVMGTVGYMAPEQVRGQAADHRADIFAFGAILYEMLTGQRAFQRATSAETMAAVLKEDPPSISQIAPNAPPALEVTIYRCLQKSVNERFHSAQDVAFALEAISSIARPTARKSHWPWAAAALAAALVGTVLWWLVSSPPPPKVAGITQITHDGLIKLGLLTDGPRIYFAERTDIANQIYEVAASGGQTAPIPTPFPDPVTNDVSSDRAELLISTQAASEGNNLFAVLPLPAGSPRSLPFSGRSAAWSPDGLHVILCKASDLFLANSDGTGLRKLLSLHGRLYGARFSPDGSRIRFTLYDPEKADSSLWEVRSDGTNPHPLLPDWHDPSIECCGKWTPDGSYYLFQSTNPDGSNIWALPDNQRIMQRSSSVPVQITNGPLAYTALEPSKDGRRIFVVGTQTRGELLHYDSRSKLFVPFLGGISAGDLEFSRDGKWVTYVAYPGDVLWRSKPDGSEALQLSFPPLRSSIPHWSPDGKQIAFVAGQAGRPWKIFMVSAQGGSPEELLSENFNELDPSWSADGTRLAFGRTGISADPEFPEIYIVDLKSRQVSTVPGSEGLFSPRWSPDGRFLVAIPSRDQTKVMLFDFQTQKWSEWAKDVGQIGRDVGQIGFISWAPDSKSVYLDTLLTSQPFFGRIQLGQTQFEPLVDLKGIHRFFGPFGPWNGIGPDQLPLVVRDLSTHEIYALDMRWP